MLRKFWKLKVIYNNPMERLMNCMTIIIFFKYLLDHISSESISFPQIIKNGTQRIMEAYHGLV